MMIILNLWIFKLSDIDQGIHKHAIQKKYEFSAFLKKKLNEKKKSNIIVSRTTLRTRKIKFCMQKNSFGKCLFAYKIRFALEKKNFGANFQTF